MTPELPKTIADNVKHFTGRIWLLPKLLDWFEQSDKRMFILTGSPGTGKSMIMAWLAGARPMPAEAEARRQLEQLCARVKAVHFCIADSGTTDPKEIARQIANQLTRNVQGFGKALAATMGDQVQISSEQYVGRVEKGGSVTGVYIANINLSGLSEELSFNRILRDPLKRLYEDGYDEPIMLFLDALDEALTYSGGTNIVQLLAKLTDLPVKVRILASTRPDPRVLMLFPMARLFDLINDAPQNVDDVKQYVLEQLLANDGLDDEQQHLLATRLSQAARGIFLYAYLVLGDLLPRLSQIPDLETYHLPDGLRGLYRDFLNRELGQDDDRWYESFKPVLGLIVVAKGEGLTQTQLKAISRKDVEQPLRKCKQYLAGELPEGPFCVFHKSFADFLLEDEDNVHRHIDASTMHGQIADYYWETYHHDWLKCDVYGLANLAIHLYHAHHFERLSGLISQEWMHARYMEKDSFSHAGFLGNLDLAWRAALEESEFDEVGLTHTLRYALIRTSLNSISESYAPALVVRAWDEGLWSKSRVFSLAKNLRGYSAVRMWAAVLAVDMLTISERNLAERLALNEAKVIQHASQRVHAIITLVDHLNGETRRDALQQGLEMIDEIKDTYDRFRALIDLAHYLDGERKYQILEMALKLVFNLASKRDFKKENECDFSIAKVAPLLDEDLASRALEIANTLSLTGARANAQIALLPRLPAQTSEIIVEQLLEIVRNCLERWRNPSMTVIDTTDETVRSSFEAAEATASPRPRDCVHLIQSLAPFLTGDAKVELLRDGIKLLPCFDNETRFRWLFKITPLLNNDLASPAVEDARRILNPVERAKVFANLAPLLSHDERERLLIETIDILRNTDAIHRLRGLVAWLPHADYPAKQGLLRDILRAAEEAAPDAARDMSMAGILAASLSTALPHLPEPLIQTALDLVLTPALRLLRDEALELLAPRLSGNLLQRALHVSTEIDDNESRVVALSAIAAHLVGKQKEEMLQYAFSSAMQIAISYHRARALAELAPVLDGADKERALLEGLLAAQNSDPFSHLALKKLAPLLTGTLIDRGVEAARLFSGSLSKREDDITEGLAIMASKLSGEAKQELVGEVFSRLQNISDSRKRGDILSRLSSGLDGQLLEQGWLEAQKLDLDGSEARARSLAEIARRLSGRDKEVALSESQAAARTIARPVVRVAATISLAEQLSGYARKRAIDDALGTMAMISEEGERAEALSVVAPLLSGDEKLHVLREALEHLKQSDGWSQAKVLRLLAPQLESELLDCAASLAESITDGGHRATALCILAARLVQEANNREKRTSMLRRIGDWLYLIRDIPRPKLLYCCTEALFETTILSQRSLGEIAQFIREICDEWCFDPTG